MLRRRISKQLDQLHKPERGSNMINIKSSLFYAALAACLGGGFGGGYVVSQRDIDNARAEAVRSVQCDDMSGKPKFDKSQRPLSTGRSF